MLDLVFLTLTNSYFSRIFRWNTVNSGDISEELFILIIAVSMLFI